MENLLEKYEKLYFSALEESLERYKSDPIALLRTLTTVSKLHTLLLTRLELALSTAEKASSTPSESPMVPANGLVNIEEIRQLMKRTKDEARGYQGQAHAQVLATGWVDLYERVGGKTMSTDYVPGPEVLGQEEYDRRQVDTVMQAVRKLSTRRLMWVVDENKLKDERLLDPGVVCWVEFAQAELQRRRDARKRGRPDDWVSDTE